MKILFLDVDGVLNYEMCEAKIGVYYGVDQGKVKLLKQIIDATGAKIVLSSTWRRNIQVGMPLECQDDPFAIELMSKLQAEGLKIYDLTPVDKSDSYRYEQIMSVMKEYKHSGQMIDAWCVLDDDMFDRFNEPEFRKHLVWTNFIDGLTEEGVREAISILNGETE